MPHDSECADCGEHNVSKVCYGCHAPLCEQCFDAGDGSCEPCMDERADADYYCPECGEDWDYCECEVE